MNPSDFANPAGRLVQRSSPGGESYWSFLPDQLPPAGEGSAIAAVANLLAEANHALGRLDGIGQFLPNPDLLVRPYMRREAVLSSRIEGTRASFLDLVAYEAVAQGLPGTDVREVANYVQALDYGLRHVDDGGISRELVQSVHRHLLTGARGEAFSTPGEFRTMQNHIGTSAELAEAHFVPPPPDEMHGALDHLLTYLSDTHPNTPVLVEAAWMHYQFEAIHPFLDGNGRVGRVLIPLLLAHRRRLAHPLLYLSPYFERRRDQYYDRLFGVSARGDWLGWLRLFLEAVFAQAKAGSDLAHKIVALGAEWHSRLNAAHATLNAHRLADLVHQFVAVDAKSAERHLEVATQTAYNAIKSLERVGILTNLAKRDWGRVYVAEELVLLLDSRD
jgi:Fic family protein